MTMSQQLIFTNSPGEAIDRLVDDIKPNAIFVIVDTNTGNEVLPLLSSMSSAVSSAKVITCSAGDVNKGLEALSTIWHQLNTSGATRSSMVINVGGGMITDMGGFAAATFKRGVHFINAPTTLLAAVDASAGGKTGINFNGCKNEIGAFAEADAVVISTIFFNTLPVQELLSGYAEMIKHSLIEGRKEFDALLDFDIREGLQDHDRLLSLIRTSVGVKERIVTEDPHEHGIRRALNLGHTVGHAFESFAMNCRHSPVPHGYAVAWGIVVELVMSTMLQGFPSDVLHRYASYVRSVYGAFDITCDDYPLLLALMAHDKKNSSPEHINFTLLTNVGEVRIDCEVDTDNIKAALDIYRDLMGI